MNSRRFSITSSARENRSSPQGRETNPRSSSWRPAPILVGGTTDRRHGPLKRFQLLTILPRIVPISACVNARKVSQGQGFTDTGGRLQRHGEKVRSDREGRILDTGRVRHRLSRRGTI